jgi:hypothetical protein
MSEEPEPTDNETYAVVLRMAAKLMAMKALKARRRSVVDGENWLFYACWADTLAEEYEAKP